MVVADQSGAVLLDLAFKIPSRTSPNGVALVALSDECAGANSYFRTHHRVRAATPRTRGPLVGPPQSALVVFALENAASSHFSVTVITFQLRSDFNGFIKLVKLVAPDTANLVH